jgi:uncharacterized membrane protein
MSDLESRVARLEKIADTAISLLAEHLTGVQEALLKLDEAAETAKRMDAEAERETPARRKAVPVSAPCV